LLGNAVAANESWDQMDALQPERNVYTSSLPVLQSLSDTLTQHLPLQRAVARFQAGVEPVERGPA
jgi:hypothetical protein